MSAERPLPDRFHRVDARGVVISRHSVRNKAEADDVLSALRLIHGDDLHLSSSRSP